MLSQIRRSCGYLLAGLLVILTAGLVLTPEINAQAEALRAESKVEGELIETELSAYQAVACSAGEINARIRDLQKQGKVHNLVLYDREFANTLSEYSILINQLISLKARYLENLPREDKSILSVQSVLDPSNQIRNFAVDTLLLFRTNTDIRGSVVHIGKEEFIARALKDLNIPVYYPNKAIPIIFDPEFTDSRLMKTLEELAGYRYAAELELAKADRNPGLELRLRPINDLYDRILNQLSLFPETASGTIKETITKTEYDELPYGKRGFYDPVGDSYILNPRGRRISNLFPETNTFEYLRAELAYDAINRMERNFHWLDVEVTVAGGNRRIKSSPLVDVFRGGNRISFSAGAVVSYRIFGSDGRILASDTIMTYIPYKKAGEITEFVCRTTNPVP